MNDMTIAGMGHNHPPGPHIPEALLGKVQDHTDAAGAWLDMREITSDEMSEKATDFMSGARGVWSELEAERKAQKKPYDDAGKAVQDLFTPLQAKVKTAGEKVGAMQTRWLKVKRDREEAARIQREAEARAAQQEADRLAREAEARNDISGMIDAEAAVREAAKEVKAAATPVKAQAGSATGAGRTVSLRTYWFADVENINHAFVAFRDHPEVRELLERLATAAVRAQQGEKVAPQGFKLRKEEKAA